MSYLAVAATLGPVWGARVAHHCEADLDRGDPEFVEVCLTCPVSAVLAIYLWPLEGVVTPLWRLWQLVRRRGAP